LARLKLQETNHNILVDTDEDLEENMSNDIEQEIQKQQLEIQKQHLLKLQQEQLYWEQLRLQQLDRQRAEKAAKEGVGWAVSIGLGAMIGTWIGKFLKSGIMKGGPVKKR